jgi:prepilin-type N-terminal cleavage/methylation domain-containing protein
MRNETVTGPARIQEGEGGFSLTEVMIALTITLIVSGAVYGLLASSQNAFRREPAVADRQAQMRNAMLAISTDLLDAGNGMSPSTQIFSLGLNGAGPAGSSGPGNSDYLGMISNNRNCPSMTVSGAQNNGANINILENPPACWNLAPGVGALFYVSGPGGPATVPSLPAQPGGLLYGIQRGGVGHINFPHGQSPYNPPASSLCPTTGTGGDCVTMSIVQYVYYAIANDTDGTPCLWRSGSGGLDPTTGLAVAPGPAAPGTQVPAWTLIARGIDDLRVNYEAGTPPVFANQPPAIVANNWTTVVRSVSVLLEGETTGQANLTGQSNPTSSGGTGKIAVRGQLQSNVTPRAAMVWLAHASPAPLWN